MTADTAALQALLLRGTRAKTEPLPTLIKDCVTAQQQQQCYGLNTSSLTAVPAATEQIAFTCGSSTNKACAAPLTPAAAQRCITSENMGVLECDWIQSGWPG